MQFTRQQIIDHLNRHHVASVSELSQALNLTVSNIRHHIKELEARQIVEEVGNLPQSGRGRPTKLYCLSKGALDHNLDYLAEILLDVILQDSAPADRSQYFERIASHMIGNLPLPKNQIQRLNRAIQWLDDHNYQPRWEASPTGPRITLGYCPYVAILDTVPEMCQIDLSLISQLAGNPMQQTARLGRGPEGAHQCVFVRRAV